MITSLLHKVSLSRLFSLSVTAHGATEKLLLCAYCRRQSLRHVWSRVHLLSQPSNAWRFVLVFKPVCLPSPVCTASALDVCCDVLLESRTSKLCPEHTGVLSGHQLCQTSTPYLCPDAAAKVYGCSSVQVPCGYDNNPSPKYSGLLNGQTTSSSSASGDPFLEVRLFTVAPPLKRPASCRTLLLVLCCLRVVRACWYVQHQQCSY